MERFVTVAAIASFIGLLLLADVLIKREPDPLTEALTLEGYLVRKHDRILLILNEDFKLKETLEMNLNEIIRNYQVVYLNLRGIGLLNGIEDGRKVRVWCSSVLESNPGIAEATYIKPIQ